MRMKELMEEFSAYVGMDVHKDSISVAIADRGRHGEIRMYGVLNVIEN